MRLFEKANKKNQLNPVEVHDDQTINLEPYAPHQSLSAVPYKEPKVMKELKSNFRMIVTDFLNNTSPDQYNASFADSILDRAMEQAISELEIQKSEHQHTIERSIVSLWKGDEEYYQRLLEDYKKEENTHTEELKKIKAIYHKGTAFEEVQNA